jgi:valyl-tRNA synthetase
VYDPDRGDGVARMIMFSLYFKNKIPFKKVYFNSIVRDSNRQKMSKTKGNVLDPLELKKEFGQDALRFALIRKTSLIKDITLQIPDLIEARSLCTKLKNATIFLKNFMKQDFEPNQMLDEWMSAKIMQSELKIKIAIESFYFNEACNEFVDIFWNNFCAWYIEGLKIFPSKIAHDLFCRILKFAHPIMPLIIEECYVLLGGNDTIMNYTSNAHEKHIKCDFENIIVITKLLRKIKSASNLKTFFIKNDQYKKLIQFYTKLAIDPIQDFKIKINNIEILIDKESAKKSEELIGKELLNLLNERANLITRMQNPAPEHVMNEWNNILSDLNEEIICRQEWLSALNN